MEISYLWRGFIAQAVKDWVIQEEARLGLHDLKRQGITHTASPPRADKQEAGGHRDESMLDVYDPSVPTVSPAGE